MQALRTTKVPVLVLLTSTLGALTVDTGIYWRYV